MDTFADLYCFPLFSDIYLERYNQSKNPEGQSTVLPLSSIYSSPTHMNPPSTFLNTSPSLGNPASTLPSRSFNTSMTTIPLNEFPVSSPATLPSGEEILLNPLDYVALSSQSKKEPNNYLSTSLSVIAPTLQNKRPQFSNNTSFQSKAGLVDCNLGNDMSTNPCCNPPIDITNMDLDLDDVIIPNSHMDHFDDKDSPWLSSNQPLSASRLRLLQDTTMIESALDLDSLEESTSSVGASSLHGLLHKTKDNSSS